MSTAPKIRQPLPALPYLGHPCPRRNVGPKSAAWASRELSNRPQEVRPGERPAGMPGRVRAPGRVTA